MINALQELSSAPEGKYLNSLSSTICSFLISCYKDDGGSLFSGLLVYTVLSSISSVVLPIYCRKFSCSHLESDWVLLVF